MQTNTVQSLAEEQQHACSLHAWAAFLFQGYTQGHTFPRERAIRLPYLPVHRYFRGAGAKEVPLPPVP